MICCHFIHKSIIFTAMEAFLNLDTESEHTEQIQLRTASYE